MTKQALASHQGPPFIKQADRQAHRIKHKKFNILVIEPALHPGRLLSRIRQEGVIGCLQDLRSWSHLGKPGSGADSRDSLLLGVESIPTLAGEP